MIHLYDKETESDSILISFCGKPRIKPGSDAVPARRGQMKIPYIKFCPDCVDSSSYSLWLLKSL